MPANKIDNLDEFKQYFNMGLEYLEKLSFKDCSQIGYRLTQFALYIQRISNKEKATKKMLEYKINTIIAPKSHQYSGNWTLQRANAINDNDAAKLLNRELVVIEQKIERIDGIATSVKNLADQLRNMQFAKKRDEL